MNYTIIYNSDSEKFLDKLDDKTYKKISLKLNKLKENPHKNNLDIKKLQGKENTFRLRVGDYRILYTLENNILIIFVIKIGHRKDAY